jgi:hypothetical protein
MHKREKPTMQDWQSLSSDEKRLYFDAADLQLNAKITKKYQELVSADLGAYFKGNETKKGHIASIDVERTRQERGEAVTQAALKIQTEVENLQKLKEGIAGVEMTAAQLFIDGKDPTDIIEEYESRLIGTIAEHENDWQHRSIKMKHHKGQNYGERNLLQRIFGVSGNNPRQR